VRIEITSGSSWNATTGARGALPANKTIIIEGYPPGHANNTSTPRFSIKSITITNAGSGYVVAPEIQITSASGFGAYATCKVTNGAISSVLLSQAGRKRLQWPARTCVASTSATTAM
jgi:hypothetical protein